MDMPVDAISAACLMQRGSSVSRDPNAPPRDEDRRLLKLTAVLFVLLPLVWIATALTGSSATRKRYRALA